MQVSSKEPCLVAVSKTKPLTLVKQAYDAGQRHFGENYIKELNMKSNNPDVSEVKITIIKTKIANLQYSFCPFRMPFNKML